VLRLFRRTRGAGDGPAVAQQQRDQLPAHDASSAGEEETIAHDDARSTRVRVALFRHFCSRPGALVKSPPARTPGGETRMKPFRVAATQLAVRHREKDGNLALHARFIGEAAKAGCQLV